MMSASNLPDTSQAKAEMMETMSDVELAYLDQGHHEMDFSTGDESELLQKKRGCQKNPGHVDFISAKEFTKEHLPACWRDDKLVYDFIKTLIYLTVRLVVNYTSVMRPGVYIGANGRPKHYPLSKSRGREKITTYGTGMVMGVSRKFSEKDGTTCPCETCKQTPGNAKKQWGEFLVYTAKHVVFDSSEARRTTCNVFYDSDQDRITCPSLAGITVKGSHIEGDHSEMQCVTHDETLSSQLAEMAEQYHTLMKDLKEKIKQSKPVDEKLPVVIVSHPHALSKHVMVGEIGGIHTTVQSMRWLYSAETCPGSSGAPICVLGDCMKVYGKEGAQDATHSKCKKKGQNESTIWWFIE